MKSKYLVKVLLFALVICFSSVSAMAAERTDITPLFAYAGYKDMKKYERIPNFKLGGKYDIGNEASYEYGAPNGVTLESLGMEPLRTAYVAFGTPKRNANGRITNAIIINAYFSADSTVFAALWNDGSPLLKGLAEGNAVLGPNKILDTNKYYIIFLDALGLWGASKPSDGLGSKFPKYNMFDIVQANYRLLKDKIGVDEVLLCTGVSMGAIQAYAWSVLHPNFCKGIMPIGGSVGGNDPVNSWSWGLFVAAIQSDPIFMKTGGNYYHLPVAEHPKKGLAFGWSIISLTGWDFKATSELPWNSALKQVFSWDDVDYTNTGKPNPDFGSVRKAQVKAQDAQDFLYRVYATQDFDLWPYLKNTKPKTLIVHVNSDNWLIPTLAEKTAKAIPGARYATFYDPQGHYGVFRAWKKAESDIVPFLISLGIEPGSDVKVDTKARPKLKGAFSK